MSEPGETDVPGLGRSSLVMATGTFLSRLLGFARAAVFSAAIGVGLVGDAFTTANTVPNMVYILLAGGVLNTIFVPQLVRAMTQDEDGGQAYADRLLTVAGLALLIIALAATAAAPLLTRLLVASNWSEQDLDLVTAFAYWCLPQIFFYGAYTMISQVLNARGNFGPMMWAPILNNVVAITSGLVFIAMADIATDDTASVTGGEIVLLAGGSTLGVAAQAAVLVPVLRRVGYRYRPRFDWRRAGLGRTGRLAVWTLLYVATNQLGYFVVVRSLNGAGKAAAGVADAGAGYAAYNLAYLVFLLPHGIVTVSIVTALVPRMSAAAAQARVRDLRADLSRGLRLVGCATVPAAVAFLAFGPDLTTVLFARNAVTAADGRYVGVILMAFAPGLVAFSAHYLVLRGFYALEDTRTPFLITLAINAVLVTATVLAVALAPAPRVVLWVAGGYTLSYAVGLALSTALLRGRTGGLDGFRVIRTHVRLILAAGLAALPAYGAARALTAWLGSGTAGTAAACVAGGAMLAAGYLALCRAMRVKEVSGLLTLLGGRFGRSSHRR